MADRPMVGIAAALLALMEGDISVTLNQNMEFEIWSRVEYQIKKYNANNLIQGKLS